MVAKRAWVRGILGTPVALLMAIPAFSQATELSLVREGLDGHWDNDQPRIEITVGGAIGKTFTDWKEAGKKFESGKLVLYFERKPTPKDMNAKSSVPLDVAEKVKDKVVWRLALTIDALADPCSVTISGKLFATPISYRALWSAAAASLGTMVPGNVLVGQGPDKDPQPDGTIFGDQPLRKTPRSWRKLTITNDGTAGTSKDIEEFMLMLEDCAMKSPTFLKLINVAITTPVTLHVGRGQGFLVDHPDLAHKGTASVNLDGVEKWFPCTALKEGSGGTWYLDDKMPIGKQDFVGKDPYAVQPWACSRCEILTHILAEESYLATHQHALLEDAHRDAIRNYQIAVRKELGNTSSGAIGQHFVDNKTEACIKFDYAGGHYETISNWGRKFHFTEPQTDNACK